MGILRWEKPPREVSVEEWKSRSADGAGEVYHRDYAEGLIALSMNGTTYLTYVDLEELVEAVSEVRSALEKGSEQ
jgi:hypothetical protein